MAGYVSTVIDEALRRLRDPRAGRVDDGPFTSRSCCDGGVEGS